VLQVWANLPRRGLSPRHRVSMMWWLFDLLGDEDDEWELPTAKGGQHGSAGEPSS